MKGENEDDKVMRPMFPRLHVNDTEKGGPRAPPRNKMALYEQLSIPLQKFNSTALPPHKPSTLPPSASLSQDGSHRKTMHSQLYLFQTVPTNNIETIHSRSFDVKNLETRNVELEGRLSGRMDNKSSHVASLDAQASSLNEDELSKRNNSCKTKYDDGDDFRVPTFVQSEATPCSKNTIVEVSVQAPLSASNMQKSCSATPNSPLQVSSSSGLPICDASASEILSKRHVGNHVEHMPGEVIVRKKHEKKNSTNLEDAGMLPGPSASDILSKRHVGNHVEHIPREVIVRKEHSKKHSTNLEDAGMLTGPSKLFLATSGGVTEANTSLLEKLGRQNTRIDTETSQGRTSRELQSLNNHEFLENRKTSKVRSNTCSGTSLGNSHGSHDYKEDASGEFRDADRSDIVSEDSMVDSISVLEISPDDVVGVIGPKQFWKARRAIVNQQRVFAIQVFELHRLIKVQKLFAASPHLLLDDTSTVKIQPKVATKSPPVASSNFQPIAQQKHGFSQKPNHNDDRPLEKSANPFPLQTQEERGPNQELGQLPVHVPHSGNLPTAPTALDNRQNPWCFHPPANQWLIPVMSPSEGLVYKPYSGPCPPAAGFMAPLYGSCGQLSLPTAAGDLLNTTNGVPASHQQQNMGVLPGSPAMGPNYFSSPYGMAMVNPVNSASAVEQLSPLCTATPNGGKALHSRGSRNMSFTRSDAFSGCPPKHNNASKDSELQASTASSPCDRPQGEGKDVLPLFPMAPAGEGLCQPSLSSGREQQSHVIKVVPHNGRSATESAARIFRSIQEERQQLDM